MSKTIRVKTAELQLILDDLDKLYDESVRSVFRKNSTIRFIQDEINQQKEFQHACGKLITDIKGRLEENEDE